jgi:hypothetical protein
MKIAVFYHVAHMGPWKTVDEEIVAALETSGLRKAADVFVRHDCIDIGLFEFPTLEMLRGFASISNYAVLYLHTKGVSRPMPSVDDWRACMLHWMVFRWRECVLKLEAGFDAVGTTIIDTPIRHFQGNFWWARTPYLRRLPSPRDIQYKPTCHDQTERHKCEFWVLSIPGAKVYQPYHHRIDPYQHRNPSENYVGRTF